MTTTRQVPDARAVSEIAELQDPVLRNLRITQAYHELGLATTDIIASPDATWVTFGCWASKTVGRFIRGEEVPAILRPGALAGNSVESLIVRVRNRLDAITHRKGILEAVSTMIGDRSAAYLAEGNRVVFEEIGGSFAGFIEAYGQKRPGESRTDRFSLDRLEPVLARYADGATVPDDVAFDRAGPVVRGTLAGGQGWLKETLLTLRRAALATSGHEKAQLVMLANMYCGLHEQTRLQRYIELSLDVPIDTFLPASLRDKVTPVSIDLSEDQADRQRPDPARRWANLIKAIFEQTVTRGMMTMHLPDGTLHMGEDVLGVAGRATYPAALDPLTDPDMITLWDTYVGPIRPPSGFLPDVVRNIVVRIRAVLSGRRRVVGTAASDWAHLEDRMRFVMAFFRSRQRTPSLLHPPFSPEQRQAILDGHTPTGKL